MSQTRQRFEGTSIENALAAAVASLGPDLEVTDARKVRSRGMLGFFAKEHYEVLAAPKLSGDVLARAEASIDDTLQSLMTQVEARELHMPPPRQTPAAFAATLAAAGAAPVEPEAELEPVEPVTPPVLAATPPVLPAVPVVPSGQPRWSRAALRELGLHDTVLSRVAVTDGDEDEDWTMALVNVLRRDLASAQAAGPDGSITVNGRGTAGAVQLINAAACGFPVASLHLSGADLPATAMELALAVRSCLPR